jgi:hypothetical protein
MPRVETQPLLLPTVLNRDYDPLGDRSGHGRGINGRSKRRSIVQHHAHARSIHHGFTIAVLEPVINLGRVT